MKIKHRGFWIEKWVKPIPDRRHDWDYWNDDSEDLCGTAATERDAKAEIDELLKNDIRR